MVFATRNVEQNGPAVPTAETFPASISPLYQVCNNGQIILCVDNISTATRKLEQWQKQVIDMRYNLVMLYCKTVHWMLEFLFPYVKITTYSANII